MAGNVIGGAVGGVKRLGAVLETIVKIADDSGVTPYKLDKVLWLIGSGYFYKHRTTVSRNGKVGTMRDSFIKKSKDFLGKKE